MKSLNKVQLIGNLGQDPDLRYTSSGVAVVNLNVATTDTKVDKGGNKTDLTEWHKIVVWGVLAENCAKYLVKGNKIYIEGSLKTRTWNDKATGSKRYATEIQASNIIFLQIGQKPPVQAQQASTAGVGFDFNLNAPATPKVNNFNGFASDAGMPDVGDPDYDDIPF